MINEKILQEEFWILFDIVQNHLNWGMSLDAFEIHNDILANDLQNNKSLEHLIQDLITSKKGLSFLMIGFRAQENPHRTKEELMFYAMRLGYAMNQLNIEDITSYEGDIIYDDMFIEYQVDNHFELLADFFSDEYMSEKLCTRHLHHESFIYFSMIMGFIIRSQLIKLKLDVANDMQPRVKRRKHCRHSIQMFPNIIIIQNETDD